MEAQLEQIREQQKATWNRFSLGWKKWDDMTMDFLHPMSDEIIRLLQPKENDRVLDVAAGTGEPGLTIAGMVKSGHVVSTDLAEGMLEVALEKAAKLGLRNFETQVCDVCDLPFADNTFDLISCRLGFMFFPDMLLAAKEMVRVLKPGGKIATSVWNGPEKNFWITATMGTISRNMELPPPPAGAPGMFRCAKSDFIADLFRQAGLKNVAEIEVPGKLNCGTIDRYWSMITEVAAPVVAAMTNADDAMKAKVKSDVYAIIKEKYPTESLAMDSSALVIYGEK